MAVCFPALYSGFVFSHALSWLCVFPRFILVMCFPALNSGCMFSRVLFCLNVLPHLALLVCFPAIDNGCMFHALSKSVRYICRAFSNVFANSTPKARNNVVFLFRVTYRPQYKIELRTVMTSVKDCCPGFTGSDCSQGGRHPFKVPRQ